MKPNIHPQYNPVVFVDSSTGAEFITASTIFIYLTKLTIIRQQPLEELQLMTYDSQLLFGGFSCHRHKMGTGIKRFAYYIM